MSSQLQTTNRFRYITFHSKRSDESPEAFRQAFLAALDEMGRVPVVQRNRLSLEVSFPIADPASLVQAARLAGSNTACDAIVIADFESIERWEELYRDPAFKELKDTWVAHKLAPVNFIACQGVTIAAQQE
ncbi:hypothetical protein FB451DRAFT_1363318 [Mycena latifolia]|nr:hypothetical protein FB451DRAFT_1363318 [Mycena latifolia]